MSGLLGIGGGVIFVPSLFYLIGLDFKVALGTSLAIMIPQVISGSATHFFNENVNVRLALLIAVSAVVGAYFGANLVEILPEVTLKRLFAILLLVVAVRTFTESL